MDVSKRVVELMERKGWSAYQLAKQSGLSTSAITNMLKRGTCPSVPTLLDICKGFSISPAEFFDIEKAPSFMSKSEVKMMRRWLLLPMEKREVMVEVVLGLLRLM